MIVYHRCSEAAYESKTMIKNSLSGGLILRRRRRNLHHGPQGKKLGRIVHGRPETTNIAFGGDDWKTLYFTNWYYLGAFPASRCRSPKNHDRSRRSPSRSGPTAVPAAACAGVRLLERLGLVPRAAQEAKRVAGLPKIHGQTAHFPGGFLGQCYSRRRRGRPAAQDGPASGKPADSKAKPPRCHHHLLRSYCRAMATRNLSSDEIK
jgi:hypothetical protein